MVVWALLVGLCQFFERRCLIVLLAHPCVHASQSPGMNLRVRIQFTSFGVKLSLCFTTNLLPFQYDSVLVPLVPRSFTVRCL